MKELLIRVRPDMHPSTTGSLDTNVGASTWNGVVLGSHVLQVAPGADHFLAITGACP